MTTETETYPDEQSWRDAMKRGATRHSTGWRTKSNSKTKLEIIWTNDPPQPPTAEEIRKEELKVKLKDDTMTHKELLEILRITGIIG